MKRPLFWIGICFVVIIAFLYNYGILPETFLPKIEFTAIEEARNDIIDLILRKFSSDVSGILCAVLVGDKSYLTSDILNNFNLSGMSHILVVSGMHLVTTTEIIKSLITKLDKKKKIIIILIFIWIYVLLTGCTISTIRASIMLTTIEIGKIFKRQGDTLTSLAIAAIIIAAFSPKSVITYSFILSFCSILGICLFEKYLPNSIAAQIGTLPAIAMIFGYIPLLGSFANILVIPLLSPVLILGMCFFLVPQIAPILNVLIKLIIFISEFFAKIPGAYFGVGAPWQKFIILTIYFFMAYCLAIKPNKIFIKNCSCILLSFTLLANIFALFVLNNVVTVIEFRKENIQIFALGKHAVIFNCPNDKDVTDLSYYLRANNITNIDAIVIEDEVIPNSLYSFIKYNKVDRIVAPNAVNDSAIKLYDETFSREKLYDIMNEHGYKFRTKIEKFD